MVFCKYCGAQSPDGSTVCPACNAAQDNGASADANNSNPVPNPTYTSNTYSNPTPPPTTDNGGFLWGLLGCCIPLAGLILFLIWKDNKPKTAKAAGIGAIVGVGIGIIFYVLMFALGLFGSLFAYY